MRTALGAGLLCLLVLFAGCTPPDGTDGNSLTLELGPDGIFSGNIISGISQGRFFDVRDALPTSDRESASLTIQAEDLAADFGTSGPPVGGPAQLALVASFSVDGAASPCATLPLFSIFNATVDSTGLITVTPDSQPLNEEFFALVDSGTFGFCLTVNSTHDLTLTVERVHITFTPPGPVTAASCADVLALPEVQEALALLETNGIAFIIPSGEISIDLEGRYTLDQETTFDPDETDIGDTQDGPITMTNQRTGAINREGFGASVEFFLQGNAGTIGLCTLDRTADPRCDQTVARIERLVRDPDSGDLAGKFLAVAVRRHRFSSSSCGARGDFIYGDLALEFAGAGPALVTSRGKVPLPDGFLPDLVALPPEDGPGVVTEADSLAALLFSTTAPLQTTELDFPAGVTGDRVGATGFSDDAASVALAIANPPRVVTFKSATGDTVRSTSIESPDTLTYLGDVLAFDPDGSRAYVAGTDDRFADRVNIVRTDNANQPDVSRRLLTPLGHQPVQVRLRPDGDQLAVLLRDAALETEADLLSFVNLNTQAFLTPPIDLVASAGGTVLASELVYSADGSLLFLAGLGAVVAIETASPFDVFIIDVSDGAEDNPVGLALSGDGAVLAVAIDDANGDADFAVIDTRTLTVVNRQDLPGIGARRALDVAHFASARVAMVANFDSTVVAVQTQSPFTADEPVRVADQQGLDEIGRIVSGGDVIAVTNLEEPAVYLFAPAGP